MKARLAASIILVSAAGLFAADNVLTPQEKAAGWVLLFDGQTLNGWSSAVPQPAARSGAPGKAKAAAPAGGAPAVGSNPRACSARDAQTAVSEGASHWEIVSGTLSPCGDPAGYLTTNETYKDFILKVDFRTGEDTNSGVFIRSPNGTAGYEVQIWKAQPAGYNTGSIVGTAKTVGEFKFIPDQWNHYEITADGDHLVVVLNGTKTLDVHDSQFAEGRIRLQYQKYPIEFKNIKLQAIHH
jgi:hypothetical protein